MMTRRDFARLAAAASLATAVPSALRAQTPAKKVRYAPVGLGLISVQHFMPGTVQGQYGEITGLVSGTPDKAKKLAAEYKVPDSNIYTYENFDTIKDNPNIDAVYIGLPNNMHAEYTIRAAKAGKHVLCEKPMAMNVKECEQMIAACNKANRKLMIAYRCHLQQSHMQARDLIRSGAMGKVQVIEGAAGFNIAHGVWRTKRQYAGGGPLMDIGIYALNAARFVLGEEPEDIRAYTSTNDHDDRFTDIEENVSWTMKFPSGALASMTSTYGANQDGFLRVHCSGGVVEINGFGYDGISLKVRKSRQPETITPDTSKDPAQFTVESDYFSRCVLDNTPVGPSGEEGLKDMQAIAKIYHSAGGKG
ncbi:MAG: Gfo/Idh/MocA family protein [Janthinobacterium lividum]